MVRRDKPSESRVWTNSDGLWIRGAICGLTLPPRRRRSVVLLLGPWRKRALMRDLPATLRKAATTR
jgi:hypothetical protein